MLSIIRVLVLLIIASCLQSCMPMLMRIKFDGRSINKIQTSKSLGKYLHKHEVEYDHLFRIKEDSLWDMITKPHKPGWPPSLRIMTIQCFNDHDSLVMKWTVCEGFLDSLKLFDVFPPAYNGPFFPTDFSKDLSRYLWNNNEINRDEIAYADLNVIIYWARFMGNLNRESLQKVIQYKHQYPDKKINVILVALDRDKNWKSKF